MTYFKTLPKLFTALLLSIIISSCADDKDDNVIIEETNYAENIENITDNVIVETYTDLATNSNNLLTAVTTFSNNKTAENYEAAKQAWKNAREPWEKSEGFLFGPVDTNGVDPAIDSWPVNEIDLEAVLDSNDELTDTYIENSVDEIKGFHTIEYLLWSTNGTKTLEDFTTREFEYLIAVSNNLKVRTQELEDAWVNSYAQNFKSAGESGSDYITQKSALETLVTGIIAIADEVANGKIENPLNGNSGSEDPTKEESRFSDNSKTDFANNIYSIYNIYNGNYTNSGKGISDVIKESNNELDTTFNAALITAIESIENITGTFSSAITNNRDEVENAQQKVLDVLTLLENDIEPIIKNL